MKTVIRIFLVLGAVLIVIALFKYIQLQLFRSSAVKTTGTVVGFKTNASHTNNRSSKFNYAPVVVFKDANGGERTYISSNTADTPEFSLNERVEVYYNGEKVLLAGRESWFTAGLFAGFGAFLWLLALLTVLKKRFL